MGNLKLEQMNRRTVITTVIQNDNSVTNDGYNFDAQGMFYDMQHVGESRDLAMEY